MSRIQQQRMENPFSTRSGAIPDYLLGREREIQAITSNLDSPFHGEEGNVLVMGLRGIGKTVMLSEAGRLARERNWLVVNSYLSEEGLITRLHQSLNGYLRKRRPMLKEGSLSVLGIGGSIGVGDRQELDLNLNERFADVLKQTKAPGLLITVDEVHATTGQAQRDLRAFGNEIQLAQRNNLPVMAVIAGSTGGIQALLSDTDEEGRRTASTFLRRAYQMPLNSLSHDEIWAAYRSAARDSGKIVGPKVLDLMTEAAQGYPYLFQLIGDRVWSVSGAIIDEDVAQQGIESAKRRLSNGIIDTALSDLSNRDRAFLMVMAQDSGPSRMLDIMNRLNVSKQQANNYQNRLITAELIYKVRRGVVDFTLPYMRERLSEFAASGDSTDDW